MEWNDVGCAWEFECSECGCITTIYDPEGEPEEPCACQSKKNIDVKSIIEARDLLVNELFYEFNIGIVLQDNPEYIDIVKTFARLCFDNRNKKLDFQ